MLTVTICRTLYHHESGKQVAAALYFVPIAAQTTRVMAKFTFKATDTPGQKGPGFAGALFSGATRLLDTLGLLHIAGSGIVDQVRPPSGLQAKLLLLLHGLRAALSVMLPAGLLRCIIVCLLQLEDKCVGRADALKVLGLAAVSEAAAECRIASCCTARRWGQQPASSDSAPTGWPRLQTPA